MQVILLERVAKLGQMGDVVDVRPGYARNYLLRQGKALTASQSNIAAFAQQKAQLEARNLESRKEAAHAPARKHAYMNAQLVRLRPRQHLIDSKEAIEPTAGDPALLIHEFSPDHRNLRDRSTPCEEAKAQEAHENLPLR